MDLLFDNPPQRGQWVCNRDQNRLLKDCREQQGLWLVEWTQRTSDRKTLHMKTDDIELQIQVHPFEPKELDASLFELKIPKKFSYTTSFIVRNYLLFGSGALIAIGFWILSGYEGAFGFVGALAVACILCFTGVRVFLLVATTEAAQKT